MIHRCAEIRLWAKIPTYVSLWVKTVWAKKIFTHIVGIKVLAHKIKNMGYPQNRYPQNTERSGLILIMSPNQKRVQSWYNTKPTYCQILNKI
jgi:hypothetical protein